MHYCRVCFLPGNCNHNQSSLSKWRDDEYLPPPLVDKNMTDITDPDTILGGMAPSVLNSNTVNKTMNTTAAPNTYVQCCFCHHKVVQEMITKHITVHINNRHIEDTSVRIADSIVKGSGNHSYSNKENYVKVNQDDVRAFINILPVTKIKDQESFSFRKFKDISAFSSASKDKRYSDFTLLVWFADTTSSYNSTYAGGNTSYFGSASERLQVHLVYDSLEEYYTISGRIYKRSQYTDHETEEGAIPDRICDQKDLLMELKRIFLFFRLSPKEVHKRAIKIMRKGFVLVESEDKTTQTFSLNHSSILEDLKKNKSSTHSSSDDEDGYGTYGYHI